MTAYGSITAFLAELGAVQIGPGQDLISEWRLGNEVLVVSARPGGAVRVARVLVESPSVDRVMDALGELHAGRTAGPRGDTRKKR